MDPYIFRLLETFAELHLLYMFHRLNPFFFFSNKVQTKCKMLDRYFTTLISMFPTIENDSQTVAQSWTSQLTSVVFIFPSPRIFKQKRHCSRSDSFAKLLITIFPPIKNILLKWPLESHCCRWFRIRSNWGPKRFPAVVAVSAKQQPVENICAVFLSRGKRCYTVMGE